jgi:UV DNA damage endonuclease
MKIGYPCINLSLDCRSSRTFRLASYSEERFKETVEDNLTCLMRTLNYNAEKGFLFFRITSDLIPFASHPVCTVPWQKIFRGTFHKTGSFLEDFHIRVSMHPDQFTLINSLDREIFRRSVAELTYHADVLDLLHTDSTAKIQIHAGGMYGDKKESIRRFIRRYQKLPQKIRKRLVIENDERLFTVEDCMSIHSETGIPLVFDVFHFRCNNNGEDMLEALLKVCATWSDRDGIPIVDYSGQEKNKKPGSHAHTINLQGFRRFIREIQGINIDIMFEIKDKEASTLKAAQVLRREKLL